MGKEKGETGGSLGKGMEVMWLRREATRKKKEKSDRKETKGEEDEGWIGSWKEGFKRGD